MKTAVLSLLVILLKLAAVWDTAAQAQVADVGSVEVTQVDNTAYPYVTIYVRVADSHNARVDGLVQENFTVSEDSQPVEITAFSGVNYEPIRTLLLLDKSTSMDYEEKLFGAKQAATTFVDQMRSQDQAALIAFDNTVSLIQDFTSDHQMLKDHINALSIGDCTAWYEAVYAASEMMQRVQGRKSIILLSDGIDCREDWTLHAVYGYGSYHSFEEALSQARLSETPVIAIALGRRPSETVGNEGYDESRLTSIADGTGGQYYHTPTGDELAELYRSLSQQAQEEYVLTYLSPRPTYDGTRRNIQVTVNANAGQEVGGVSGTETYLEEHLVTIESDWRIAAAALIPLVLSAAIPIAYFRRRQVRVGKLPSTSDIASHQIPDPPSGMACANCGHRLRREASFCPACGLAVSLLPRIGADASRYPKCTHPTRPGARFCSKCGYRFS